VPWHEALVQERRSNISWMVVANDGFAWTLRVSVVDTELEVGLSLPQEASESADEKAKEAEYLFMRILRRKRR
jgi:hypothetical protein